eukprot:jgi/Hompol1/4342/HPOL_003605-RA
MAEVVEEVAADEVELEQARLSSEPSHMTSLLARFHKRKVEKKKKRAAAAQELVKEEKREFRRERHHRIAAVLPELERIEAISAGRPLDPDDPGNSSQISTIKAKRKITTVTVTDFDPEAYE